jgi:hypothetical protein
MDLRQEISAAELAALLRLTERSVSELVRKRVITKSGKGFVLAEAVGAAVEHYRAKHASPAVLGRAKVLEIQAKRAEAAFKREVGDLVPAKEIHKQYQQAFLQFYRGVPQCVWALAAQVPGLMDRYLWCELAAGIERLASNVMAGRPYWVDGDDSAHNPYDRDWEATRRQREAKGERVIRWPQPGAWPKPEAQNDGAGRDDRFPA